MKKLAKKAIALLVTGVLTMGLVTGCGIDNDATVAKVGDTKISLGVANFYARYQQAATESAYIQYYGAIDWSAEMEEGVTMEQSTKKGVIENLQTLYLMDMHAKDYNITLTAEEQDAINKAAKEFVKKNSNKAVRKISANEKVVAEVFRLFTVQMKVDEAMVADVNREVSDEEAAQKLMSYATFSYSTTAADGSTVTLTDDEKAELKKKAKQFLKKAKKAEDLEALAKEYGVTWTKDVAFDAKSTSPAADVVKAVDALKKENKFASLIETDTGLYVAQLNSKFDREATDKKKESIITEREDARRDELLEEWKAAVTMTVDEKVWAKVDFDDFSVSVKATK